MTDTQAEPPRETRTVPATESNGAPGRTGAAQDRPLDTTPGGPSSEVSGEVPVALPFAELYRVHLKDAVAALAAEAVTQGADPDGQAREYAERGKPDFVLAYLLLGAQPDEQRREVYALAHERRASLTEQRAADFDQQFHRPFPLLRTEAAKDRMIARRVRAGRPVQPEAGKHLPLQ